jgi:hypothetical protein
MKLKDFEIGEYLYARLGKTGRPTRLLKTAKGCVVIESLFFDRGKVIDISENEECWLMVAY